MAACCPGSGKKAARTAGAIQPAVRAELPRTRRVALARFVGAGVVGAALGAGLAVDVDARAAEAGAVAARDEVEGGRTRLQVQVDRRVARIDEERAGRGRVRGGALGGAADPDVVAIADRPPRLAVAQPVRAEDDVA